MAEEDFPFQISDKINEIIFLARGYDAENTVERFVAIRTALAAAGMEKAARPAPTLQEATQNVQTQLGGTPVTGGGPPKPQHDHPGGDGDLHPTKNCPVCGAALKITEKVTNKGDRWYRKLECSADYKHTKAGQDDLVWSEDFRKRKSY